ncbi:uncharacterized protein ABID14_001141 [Peptoniphilus olsenii]|uniref:DUF177 domain-containing protein n=1 Tax=Peptoniphilus olsenii TaxID=411570 RepID=A0ABV2JC88_9FIRM
MKLDLSRFLSSDVEKFDFQGELALNDTNLEIDDLRIIFPIKYSGSIYDLTGELVLNLKISYDFIANCDRCLVEFKNHKETSYKAYNFKDPSFYDEDSTDEYFKLENDSINLSEIILSQVITSLPGKNLCNENCKGLCPNCGQNLNEGECNCSKEETEVEDKVDPRFEKLLDLFKDEEV